jgi:hypothetical protein
VFAGVPVAVWCVSKFITPAFYQTTFYFNGSDLCDFGSDLRGFGNPAKEAQR